MTLTLGYPSNVAIRTPTQAEVQGAGEMVLNWIMDVSNDAFRSSVSFKFDRTEINNVIGTTQTVLSANLRAVFKANTIGQVPSQLQYMTMLTSADGNALIRDLGLADPDGSIYNSVNQESRVIVPTTSTLAPGSTLAPDTYIPPCAPSSTVCKDGKKNRNGDEDLFD